MRYLYTSWHFCIPTYRLHGTRTVRCWYGTRTAADTSPRRFAPGACAGCANGLRFRLRGLQEAPAHRGPAGGPRRRVAPDGGRVQVARALCDNGGDGFSRGVWCLVCVETWYAPVLREGLCWVKSALAHVTPPPSRLCERRHCCITRS